MTLENRLEELITPERMMCRVEARSKKHALEILSELLASADPSLTAFEIFQALAQRERLGSTGLGQGVAIPHGRLAGIEKPIAALVRLAERIEFDAADGKPVGILLGYVVPDFYDEDQVNDLAWIVPLMTDPEKISQAFSKKNSRELFAHFSDTELVKIISPQNPPGH